MSDSEFDTDVLVEAEVTSVSTQAFVRAETGIMAAVEDTVSFRATICLLQG